MSADSLLLLRFDWSGAELEELPLELRRRLEGASEDPTTVGDGEDVPGQVGRDGGDLSIAAA